MKVFLSVCCAMLLSGCSAFQMLIGPSPSEIDTANKALAASATQIAITAELATDLLGAGVITPAQATAVRDGLQPALDVIRAAQEAVELNGDPSQAGSAVEAAGIALGIAMKILTEAAPDRAAYIKERISHGSDYCGGVKRGAYGVSFDHRQRKASSFDRTVCFG